jgi:hypothetical protein
VLDFPFQAAATNFAAGSQTCIALRNFFVDDDWYIDADSNVYQLPTFLGNHDMGRIGLFIPVSTATIHYLRPDGVYDSWGLHLWGDAIAPGVATSWDAPRQRDGVDSDGAFFRIPLANDLASLNFIVHTPSGDDVPSSREPGGDRSFVPRENPEIWLVAGDPTTYYTRPG